ncbi:hypothetical protein CSKR_113001 [Clonorchis sinensis]|uniref:Uncharacterized protein n=2 Tax=Clonorchis sinensis TaxID=79923 RepID=A0A8T1MZK6_CLOSI|nr:hypothetical protein CSKR_113001 [Clonorchis sinensis]GAA48828.1 hypothetical protein CLF_102084 [Clonorchis sinensis]
MEKIPLATAPTSNSINLGTIARDGGEVSVIRPKKQRRYHLLTKERLRVPKNSFTKKYEYTKHMPLINISSDDEDNEELDSHLVSKVSNRSLSELLSRDNNSRTLFSEADEDDMWDLTLSLPHESPTRRCGCFRLPPNCTIS